MARPWERYEQPPQQGGTFIPDPYAAGAEARADRQADVGTAQTQVRTAIDAASVPYAGTVAEAEARRAQAQAIQAQAQAEQAVVQPVEERETRARQEQGARETAQRTGQTVLRSITRSLELLKDMPQGSGTAGSAARRAQALIPGTPSYYIRQQIEDFQNNIGVQSLQEMRDNSPTGGAMGNISEKQVQMLRDLMGSFDVSQPVDVLEENLNQVNNNFLEIMYGTPAERERLIETGVMPPEMAEQVEGAYRGVQFDEFGRRVGGDVAASDRRSAAGTGAREQSLPIPPEMQQAHAQYLADNWGNITPEGYTQFRTDLDRQHGFEPRPEAYAAIVPGLNDRAAEGGGPDGLSIPAVNAPLEGVDRFRNDMVSNPVGSFGTSAINAAALGIPTLFDREGMEAMRETNPTASFLGEIAGGIGGAIGTGMGVGALAGRVANPTVANLLANPITADVGYGAVYGATQAENPIAGAVGGAAAAGAGSWLGSRIANRFPNLALRRRPEDTLSPAERAVSEATTRTGRDDVLDALMRAEGMGVPLSPADASPDLGNVTGAALRRSPTAGGAARETLENRSAGQYDRFLGAVERDLGPIQNIPQRSEDLLARAREQARPLYEQAYAAPGASSVSIEDLATSPTFRDAMQEAYKEVADELLDPTSMGFDFNAAGDVVLTRTPSWQTLDYIKRGLDNIIDAGSSVIDGMSPAARRALRMKNELLGRMDPVNPAYAQARAAYAGPAAERAIMRRGQGAMRGSPDQLGVDVAGMTPEQLGQMQLGFQSQLAERAGQLSDSSNPFNNIMGRPDMRQRLDVLYPEGGDNVARLLAQSDMERQMAGSTNRLIGNSMTAERAVADQAFQQSQGMAGPLTMGAAEMAVTGVPAMTALRYGVGRPLIDRFRRGGAERAAQREVAMADEIVPMALNTNPGAASSALQDMYQRDDAYQAILEELMRSTSLRGGRAGAGVGAAASTGWGQ